MPETISQLPRALRSHVWTMRIVPRLLPAIFILSDQSITIGGGCNVFRHLCREPFQIAGLERLASAVMGGYPVGDLLFAHGLGANRRPAKELRVPKACDNVP